MAHRSRFLLPFLLALGAALAAIPGGGAHAQGSFDCPPPGSLIEPGLLGVDLQEALRGAYRPPVGLSYGDARDVMFSSIDNEGGSVEGIYTGFTVTVNPASSDPRGDAFAAGLNTEHTWPQSKGADSVPMRADLHHLFPSEIDANNARASFPFDEIDDAETDLWYRLKEVTPTPDDALRDLYSELDRAFPGTNYEGRWEPRESRKGDVARAMFYFYTVYRAEANAADPAFFGVQRDALRAWHHADPVDETEYERTCAIAPWQAGRVNPFVIDPTLVDRAYFPETPVRLARFEARAEAGEVILEWETASEEDHRGFSIVREVAGHEVPLTATLLDGGPAYRFVDRTGTPGARTLYWLEAVARTGARERFGPREIVYPRLPAGLAVFPSPARAGDSVRFRIPVASGDGPSAEPGYLQLFDLAGRRVVRLPVDAAGSATWDGRGPGGIPAAPGLYFIRARVGSGEVTGKLVLLR